jgi:hypothetical protein
MSMSSAEQTHQKGAVVRQGLRFDPETWIRARCVRDGTPSYNYWVPYNDRTKTGMHVLRGICEGDISDEERDGDVCGWDAAVRRLTDGGTEDYCKRHAPEEWLAALDGETHVHDSLVDLRHTCEKSVTNDSSAGFDRGDPVYDPEGVRNNSEQMPSVHECGDRAFVLVTDSDRYGRAFCRTHAMPSWLRPLRIETGYPDDEAEHVEGVEQWADDMDVESCVWVDAGVARCTTRTLGGWRAVTAGMRTLWRRRTTSLSWTTGML